MDNRKEIVLIVGYDNTGKPKGIFTESNFVDKPWIQSVSRIKVPENDFIAGKINIMNIKAYVREYINENL